MLEFLRALPRTGILESFSEELKNKIYLANILSITLISVLLFYSVVCYIYIPEMVVYCIIGAILYGSALFLSSLNLHRLARWIVAVAPMFVISLLHALAVMADEPNLYSIYIFQFAAIQIPLVLFAKSERLDKALSFGMVVILFFSFESFKQLFEHIELTNREMFRMPIIDYLISGGAAGFSAFLLLFLQNVNSKQEKKNQTLLEEANRERELLGIKQRELNETLDQLEGSKKDEAKRSWATQGLAELGSIMRSFSSTEKIADDVLQFTIHYLGANQGAIFLYDEDKRILKSVACYAYDRKKHLKKEVQPGEGLIGQCFLEKEHIYMTEVPTTYVNITSGLGDAPPTSILIVPLVFNGEVYGIFEIACFHQLEEYHIEFMNQLGENLAVSMRTLRANEKTREMLERTQQDQEELRAQEEEMRQNMEEMQATQEEMKRIKDQSDQLFNNLSGAIYICRNDEKFTMEFMTEPIVDICGYSADDFLSERIAISDLFPLESKEMVLNRIDKEVAKAIATKSAIEFKYELRHKNGGVIPVIERGKPIVNHHGEVTHFEGLIIPDEARMKAE
ncbi:MAG: GAF domain-containing protein [Cyclobacteriaceae bacterium]|nr:GAF domain-containing protein [Cyclobacteriaceae bacterium]MCH8517305.1 GAF domain-containing protein [Cyclobacteriaceae bacterium]